MTQDWVQRLAATAKPTPPADLQQPADFAAPESQDILQPQDWVKDLSAQSLGYEPGYWEDPGRVARYYHTLRSLPPGAEPPQGIDALGIEAAYSLFEQANEGKPWWTWNYLGADDPGRSYLQSMAAPPEDLLWPGEEGYGANIPKGDTPENISQFGMTDEQWAQLPLLDRVMMTIFGSGDARLAGGATGLVAGLQGGPVGAVVGGLLGAGLGGVIQRHPKLADMLMWLDYPAEWLERGTGAYSLMLLSQLGSAEKAITGSTSLPTYDQFLRNVPAAFKAGHLAMDVATLKPYTTINLGTGQLQQVTNEQIGYQGLIEVYDRIVAGENSEQVYQEISNRLGWGGQARELLGHIFADPLNVVGLGIVKGVVKPLAMLGGNDVLQIAAKLSSGPIETMQTYGGLLRATKPIEEISQMGAVSRWLGAVTKTGEVKAIQPIKPPGTGSKLGGALTTGGFGTLVGYGIGGPVGGIIGGALFGRLGYTKGFSYLTNLTPAARASEVINNSALNLAVVLERAGGDPDAMVKYIRGMANTPHELAAQLSMASLEAPDAAAIPIALKDYVRKADNMITAWHATDIHRATLEGIADITGRSTEDILRSLDDPKKAEILLKEYGDLARAAGNEGAEIVRAIDSGELTAKTLQEMYKSFVKDGLPYNEEQFRGQLYASAIEHMADWSAKWYNVEPDPTLIRLGKTIKNAQSLVLLGMNPTYLVNNVLNNMVTIAAEGVFGLRRMSSIDDIWKRSGIRPPRLKAGVGPAAAGEVDIAAIRAATVQEGLLNSLDNFFTEKANKWGLFSNLSMKFEQWSSAQAVTSGYVTAWSRLWRKGAGYDKLPPALEGHLRDIDPNLPGLVYQAIQDGMNQAEIETKLWSGIQRRGIESFIDELAQERGVNEADIRQMMNETGVSDFLKDKLGDNPDDKRIRKAFDELRDHMEQRLDEVARRELIDEAEQARTRVTVEGGQAALEIYDNLEIDEALRWMENFDDWEKVYADTAEMTAGEAGAVKRRQFAIEQQAWERQQRHKEAGYLGITEALGIENQNSRKFIDLLGKTHSNWQEFHKIRKDKLGEFFDTIFTSRERRNAVWNDLQDELQVLYSNYAGKEMRLAEQMDKIFTDMFAAQYGQAAGEAALAWRKGVRDIRDTMIRDMKLHRDSMRGLTMEEQRLAWTKFLDEEYRPKITQRFQQNIEGARQMYDIATGRQTPPEAPPPPPRAPEAPPAPEAAPIPEAPPQPTEPTSASLPIMITNDMRQQLADLGWSGREVAQMEPQRAWDVINNQEISPARLETQRLNDIRQIAGEYGVGIERGDTHLVNILKQEKYSGDPQLGSLREAEPEWVRQVLETRKQQQETRITQAKGITGDSTSALGNDPNNAYEFQYRVVELNDLIASHSKELELNPDYPAELQPRIRDRQASQMQIDRIANELNPTALLIDTHRLDSGPMIVGPDLVVESGNGRIMALRRASEIYPERYKQYSDALKAQAEGYGIDPTELDGFETPVLVRQRLTDVDRVKFTAEANERTTLAMSPVETALQDAGRVNERMVKNLEVGEDESIEQALKAARNRDIVRAFSGSLAENERANILDAKGELNSAGLERLKNALFSFVYPGEAGLRLLSAFVESIDPGMKRIETALYASLGNMVKLEASIKSGVIDEVYSLAGDLSKAIDAKYSLADDLSKAIDTYARLKSQGMDVGDYLKQGTLFGREINEFQVALLKVVNENAKSTKAVREFIKEYVRLVQEQPARGQMSMLDVAPKTKGELLDEAVRTATKSESEFSGFGFTEAPVSRTELAGAERPRTGGTEPDTGDPIQEAIREREQIQANANDWRSDIEQPLQLLAGDIRQTVRDGFTRIFGAADEEADAVMKLMDARAQAWAKANQANPADWWKKNIAGVGKGDPRGSIEHLFQTVSTDTPEFRKWFGNSKVVDEQGKPLVVYHGTKADFETFDISMSGGDIPGAYFSPDPKIAGAYAELGSYRGGNLKPVYLSLQNPASLDDFRRAVKVLGDDVTMPKVRDVLVADGFDGLMSSTEIVAFEPTQIKSIFNRGTFDPGDANILRQDPKGAVQFLEDGRALIYAMRNPDVSTLVHEVGHIFRRDLGGDDLKIASEWAGAQYDEAAKTWRWDVVSEEKFARAFERYITEGEAPTTELIGVFEKLKRWMLSIYNSITGSQIDVEISPQMRDLFDRMLGKEAESYGVTRDGQSTFFGKGEDTPLFSGVAQKAVDSTFQPTEQPKQETLFPMAPEMKGAKQADEWFDTATGPKRLLQGGVENTDTPEFKRWFGNSKVVDESGKPLVVYHGTGVEFSEFDYSKLGESSLGGAGTDTGFFFAKDKDHAEYWANNAINNYGGVENIMSVYLRIENPAYIDASTSEKASYLSKFIQEAYESTANYDGAIVNVVGDDGIRDSVRTMYVVFAKETDISPIKSVFNKGSFDPNNPNILYQDIDGSVNTSRIQGDEPNLAGAALGSVEGMEQSPPMGKVEQEAWRTLKPMIDWLEIKMRSPEAQVAASIKDVAVDPAIMMQLKTYLARVYGQMSDTKLASLRWAENRRDAALLNYSRRYGFDNVIGTVMPYSFWGLHSTGNWAIRAIDKPGWLATYARIRNLQNRTVAQPGFPSRLKNKMRIPVPFLPKWAGGAVYIDPIHQMFPFEMLVQPFDRYQEGLNQQDQRALYILQDMIDSEEATQQQVTEAIQTRSGELWNKALAQARLELGDETSNPMDFISIASSPSLPLSILQQYTSGTPEKIGHLPVTRLVQNLTAWLKPGGVNLEGSVRRALGLPERGEFGDFYIDRELANMVADGTIDLDSALNAMIERQGEAYTIALDRVGKTQAMRSIGAGLWMDFFPEGEETQRGLQQQFSQAIESGDSAALTTFFEENPEYQARMMMTNWDDPEERMKRFLISKVWDSWNELPDLHKKQAAEQLGQVFDEAFLNKETRSYDSIDIDTLAYWAQSMGATLPDSAPNIPAGIPGLNLADPQATNTYQLYSETRKQLHSTGMAAQEIYYQLPEGQAREQWLASHPEIGQYWNWRDQFLAKHPEIIPYAISQDNQLANVEPQIAAQVYAYRAERGKLFPNIFETQDGYYQLPAGSARRNYLTQHPELKDYWTWQRTQMAQYPEIIPHIRSTESIAEAVLGKGYEDKYGLNYTPDMKDYDAPLISALLGYYYNGETLGNGASATLRNLWERNGKPGGSLQAFIDTVLKRHFVIN